MLRMFRQLDEKRQNDESGFTLIELLVVIIIIGILAAIAIPVFLSQRERAWRSAVQSDLRNAAVAMETYYTDEGEYTESVEALIGAGFTETDSVNLAASTNTTDQAYCLAGLHTNNPTEVWYMGTGGTLDTDSGVGCPADGVTAPTPAS